MNTSNLIDNMVHNTPNLNPRQYQKIRVIRGIRGYNSPPKSPSSKNAHRRPERSRGIFVILSRACGERSRTIEGTALRDTTILLFDF
jgi:hypothetical protein